MAPDRTRHPSAWVVVAILAGIAAWNALGFWRETVDDAWISLVYARNLVAGHGLVWMPGERVEGFSNPPWVLLEAAALAVGLPGMATAKAVGVAAHAALVVVAGGLAFELLGDVPLRNRLAAAIAAGVAGWSLPAASWAPRGLETTLHAALLAGAAWRLLVELRRGGRPWSAVLVGLAALTRPEAPLEVLPLVLVRLWRARRPEGRRGLVAWLGLAALPMAAWLAFRLSWYGLPLASTAYRKGTLEGPAVAWTYLAPWLRLEWPWVVAGLAGLVGLGLRRPRALGVLGVFGAALAFVLLVGRDWMPNARFAVALVPFLGAGLAWLAGRAGRWGLAGAVVLLGWTAWRSGSAAEVRVADGRLVVEPRTTWFPAVLRQPTHEMSVVATWLMERAAPGATVAFTDIGAVGWMTDFRIIDIAGLTNLEWSGATGLDLAGQAAWLGERRPDWIVLKVPPPSRFRAIAGSPWLRRDYDVMQGPQHTLAARRKDARLATEAEILAAFEEAVRRLPGNRRLLWRRAVWAQAVGDAEARRRACADIAGQLPADADLLARCERIMAAPPRPPPSRDPEPLAADLARHLAPAPGASEVAAPPAADAPETRGATASAAGTTADAGVQVTAAGLAEGTAGPRPEAAGEASNPFDLPGGHDIGQGWIPFPVRPDPRLSRRDGALWVEAGTPGSEPVVACTVERPARGAVRVVGSWGVEGVEPADADAPGAHVFLVLRDAEGRRLRAWPRGPARFTVGRRRGSGGAEVLDEVVELPEAARTARLCVEVSEGRGRAWFRDLRWMTGQVDRR